MVSLTDLRSAAVSLDWHEAVAAGAALAALLVDAEALACPRPADVLLLPSGELRVSGTGDVDATAAAGVALVMGELLEAAPCPAELRQLIETYAADGRTGSEGAAALAELLSGLAFFERPGRREVLAAVASRAASALERAQRSAALEALTERTRLAAGGARTVAPAPSLPTTAPTAGGAQPPADEGAQGWDPPDDGGLRRMIVPAAVGLVAFLAVAYVAAAWLDRPPPAPSRTQALEDDLPISSPPAPGTAPGTGGRQAPGTAAPASAAASPPQRSTAAPRERPPEGPATAPAAAPPAAVADPSPAASDPPARRAVDVVVAERDGRVVASPIAPVRPASRAPASGRVFQSGDPQVTPAILIRPLLPDHPPADVPEEQIGTLEFIVAETGAVEHVHLVSPTNRFQERMLVAAAKAWQFQPATRDGRPVRFRTRIRVTL